VGPALTYPGFKAATVSRRDASPADGIHLLWTAPPAAGYSVHGFDIQRRERQKPRVVCHTLTSADLARLHQLFRLETPLGSIAVSKAPCPEFPDPVPDEPIDPTEESPDRTCVDFGCDDFPDSERGVFAGLSARVAAPSPRPPKIRTVAGVRGLDVGTRLEMDLPGPASFIEATVVALSKPLELQAVNAAGVVVGTAATSGSAGQPETLLIRADGIVKAVLDVPANKALLLRFCHGSRPKLNLRCVDFREFEIGVHPNPLSTKLADLFVLGHDVVPLPRTRVQTVDTFTGLNCGYETRIRLVRPAAAVRLTLVTFASKVRVDAFEADGALADSTTVSRSGRPQSVMLTGSKLSELRVHAPQNEAVLLSVCIGAKRWVRDIRAVTAPRPVAVEAAFVSSRANALRSSAARAGTTSIAAPQNTVSVLAATAPSGCLRYRVSLRRAHNLVQVTVHVPGVLAVALRDGKAVDSRLAAIAGAVQVVTFEGRAVDEVVLYVSRATTFLQICVDEPKTLEEEEKEWASVPFIAKGVQLPLTSVNGAVTTGAQELALARSRLLAGEAIATADFQDLSRMLNEAVAAGPAAPVVHTLQLRDTVDDPFLEFRPWPFAQATTADAAWRRALGFAWLDKASGLTPNMTYDYRITGHFRRRDVEHDLIGLHIVPNGTQLPPIFQIGPVHFGLPRPRSVRMHPGPGSSTVRNTGRIGLPLQPGILGGRSLMLSFDRPTRRVVLELEPSAGGTLSWVARTPDSVIGFGGSSFSGSFVPTSRVTLNFPEPVETLELRGVGLLYGVRLLDAADGNDIVRRAVVVPGVRFVDTAAPVPPPVLGTTNLQEPLVPGDPAVTTANPPQALGFQLSWLPPPTSNGGPTGPTLWPTDLGTFPPFDVLGFRLERRQVDIAGAFVELSNGPSPMLFFGNRAGRQSPAQIGWGSDLREVFPEGYSLDAANGANPYMTAEDVLRGPEVPDGPRPGSTFQYRIFSLDAIGRRSASGTTGSVVRLEKHLAPPQPPGPPAAAPARLEPSGVRARVLQAADPDLTPDDRTLLGASTNAVVLEWGWTADERARDPFATEFRVYWQPIPPDVVTGVLQGPANLVGGRWQMTATLNQPVQVDALAGKYVRAADYPFKIASNTAGQTIAISLEPSALEPSTTPTAAPFVARPSMSGEELRPQRWDERSAVIPIGAGAPQPFVFRDRLTVDAAHPGARVWVGVSTADSESYVADELPGSVLNGGRPGNESSISAAPAEARYLGRPAFTPPPPLAVVPEVVSSEPVGDSVLVELDLPGLLPTVSLPAGHAFVLERIPASALLRGLSRRGDGTIGVAFPDRTTAHYTLANSADQAALLDQIATGEGARVEGRFIVDLMNRFPDSFETLWARAEPDPIPFTARTVHLPADAERYLFRIRLSDPAGHRSAEWAMVPRFIRAMSVRAPGAPRIEMPKSDTDTVTATVRVVDAFDLKWLLLFPLAEDATIAPVERSTVEATLLRLPDRRDLYPDHGVRLRLADGTLLPPTVVDLVAQGVAETPDLVTNTALAADFDQRVSVWTISMTRDGIPSKLAGPVTATTGARPLVVPALSVAAAGGVDTAMWGVPLVPAEVRLERSTDGGVTWTRVSPWLPSSTTDFALPGAGARVYRLVLRGRVGQAAAGQPVLPT